MSRGTIRSPPTGVQAALANRWGKREVDPVGGTINSDITWNRNRETSSDRLRFRDKHMAALQKTWLLSTVALLALLGCGRGGSVAVPAALGEVAPNLIERHGNLHFVRDPAVGFQAATRHGLPCLLFFTAEWCTYCHQMEAAAFTDGVVGALANSFVCILIDADREPALCRHYEISGFPTIQFIAPDGRLLHRLVGRQTAAMLATGMRAASNRYAWLTEPSTTLR